MLYQEIELGGQKRRLALDLNAHIAFRELTGKDIIEIGASLADAKMPVAEKLRTLRMIVWGMLASAHPEFESDPRSQATVGSWMQFEDLPRVAEAVGELISRYATKMGERSREFEGQMAPYVPSPMPVVRRMVELAELGPGKVAVDLGAGDGRLMVAALEAGAGITGYELHEKRYEVLRAKIAARLDSDRAGVIREDIRTAQVFHADVVFLYLLPGSNAELRPKLLTECKPGALVISHDFDMPEWEPERTERVEAEDRTHTVYVYRVPAAS